MNQENHPIRVPSPDAELIARAQKGEEKAFEALFHSYKRRVYHLCLRMTGNPFDAEETTQETFLMLFRKVHTFRGESSFSTWLLRVAMNIVLMRRRKRKLNEISLEGGTEVEDSEHPQVEFGAPDTTLESMAERVSLQSAIEELPEGYRRVFELHDVLGYQHHEIAEILGCSIGNSKSQLFKARVRLRKLLGPSLRPRRSTAAVVAMWNVEPVAM
jgi:RNA polymerase sigma-70 factor (ECF subfamily)